MILGELHKLYHLLATRGVELPRMGWSRQKVSYRVFITEQGEFVRIEDARVLGARGAKQKQVLVMRELFLPGEGKPSGSGVNPCFLWDNGAYMLGSVAVKSRAVEYFEEFRRKHLEVESAVNSAAFSAVCRFLEKWCPDLSAMHFVDEELYTGNGVFRILGEENDVHEDEQVIRWWDNVGSRTWRTGAKQEEASEGMCLVTGLHGPIASLHEPPIKGVADAQSSGAKLVSFNCKSFESYGKEKSLNSPVSPSAAFAYCNALNYLLSSSGNRVRIGDATAVFWTDAPKDKAQAWEKLARFSIEPDAQDENLSIRLHKILSAFSEGKAPSSVEVGADDVSFFILGISPNAARLSVRFFLSSTLGDFLKNICLHYSALKLQPRGGKLNDPAFISPFLILRETVRETKEISPLFAGALMRAVLSAQPYPTPIAVAILRRIRVDGFVNYVRCAYLKAWLTRNLPNENIAVMLDKNNTHPGYLLGRAFAVLQKTQEASVWDNAAGEKAHLNRELKETFYASASATPRGVFPRLFKLTAHHLAKLSVGRRVYFEKMMQEILASVPEIPARLNLTEQSFFALGYYHQVQDFFNRNATSN